MGYGEIGRIVQSNLRLGTAEEASFCKLLQFRHLKEAIDFRNRLGVGREWTWAAEGLSKMGV